MNIRKTFFWLHLILGCSAAIFIFLMSITGVALTYERQMIKAAERTDYPIATTSSTQVLPLSELLIIAKGYPTKKIAEIVIENQPNAPIIVKDGRKKVAYLNPYTGAELAVPGQDTKTFFSKLRAFHRWLTFDGKFSETGRWVNGSANIIFLVLILSGLYLWLPKRFNSRAFKQRLTLSGNYPNKSARNYQWHNVFGVYMAPVLFVLVVTALFFSFKWPGNTLKNLVSTESFSLEKPVQVSAQQALLQLPVEQQLLKVKARYPQWQTIQFSLGTSLDSSLDSSLDNLLENIPTNNKVYQVDQGNGGEPQKRLKVLLNKTTGDVVQEQKFEHLSTYSKLRSYIRFLHTGEIFGPFGQTLAGLASLLACLLVYTGAMLSWRRWRDSRKVKVNTPVYAT
ncbi:PepSY-associated TM helix domain-containing protein [Colwellia sp. 12G3]|uniref:PepSY-associated TM helix domain-containing protein n=1 Tax=Colwellia sp. 12G3 TaxID=2058299 RepID=UPI000C3293FD|nr:PepSY-associated TM helix domain-containing protein [Colwellia sp. 12G3]PKI17829.1 PepSY domain-containing protein [Colwellia sp. 12G3]